jgi:uncharacterized protein YjiS (DUF1127 family)
MMSAALPSQLIMKASAMPRSAALSRPTETASLRRLATSILRALHLRQTRQHLAQLEPHLLRDIGLTQDQARGEASRPLWDAPHVWLQRD